MRQRREQVVGWLAGRRREGDVRILWGLRKSKRGAEFK
jgi:hypothetical protein